MGGLLCGSFRPFGFLMDALLVLIIAGGLLYLWILWQRPGHGPASDNVDDVLTVAKTKLERGEISDEEYARIKGNLKD